MRISTVQAFNNGISGLQSNYGDVSRSQEQISTGKKILTPADDPVASIKLLQLSQEEALNGQYNTGMTAAKNSLTTQESMLTSVETVLTRIREIAVQAGNGALDPTDRASLAKEVGQREDELMNLMNSKDASGKYLFSGSMGDTQPYVRNADGTYSYNGDEGQRSVQIASSTFVPLSDSGKDAFENNFNANRVDTSKGTTNTGTGRISLGLVTDKGAYDSTFPASAPPVASDGIGIHFLDDKKYVVYDLAKAPTAAQWAAYDPANPPAGQLKVDSLDSTQEASKSISYGGVKVQMDGVPAAGDEFKITRDTANEKRSLLNVVSDLRKALENGDSSTEGVYQIRDSAAVALSNLDTAYTQVDGVRGKVGARLNVIDSTSDFIANVSLVNKSVQSDLQDLDYPEALSRYALQNTVLQASQQSFVKIAQLSLFKYL
ncbi:MULTISPECIES: flagellar hook-associated protein FlgL [Pseudomonas]|uniref:flagellar hook-associated protein FlgL n=1 Tax=Pseudomonas TaxID=286 RepID=UPI00041357D0|nr:MULTISPECIES: flagellar hook-associated protein FlgL [Pseudomonas]MBA1256724.1 flagellar hook-associated protein FlgL [Pseudomonas psychrotolerans]MBH3330050.1 flagellar hook-associated protein FlgL [Pseudomonas oryzihabitans]RAU42998.1 flagellar hook-associated protein 3 [Pseudomonas sp. RIT 411]